MVSLGYPKIRRDVGREAVGGCVDMPVIFNTNAWKAEAGSKIFFLRLLEVTCNNDYSTLDPETSTSKLFKPRG